MERLRQEKDEEIDKIVMDYEMKLSLSAEDIRKQCERQKEVSTRPLVTSQGHLARLSMPGCFNSFIMYFRIKSNSFSK